MFGYQACLTRADGEYSGNLVILRKDWGRWFSDPCLIREAIKGYSFQFFFLTHLPMRMWKGIQGLSDEGVRLCVAEDLVKPGFALSVSTFTVKLMGASSFSDSYPYLETVCSMLAMVAFLLNWMFRFVSWECLSAAGRYVSSQIPRIFGCHGNIVAVHLAHVHHPTRERYPKFGIFESRILSPSWSWSRMIFCLVVSEFCGGHFPAAW